MQANLPQWLSPPAFQDEEQNRVSSLVYSTLMLTLTLSLIGTTAAAFVSTTRSFNLIPNVLIILFELLAVMVLYRGHVRTAAWLMVGTLWFGIVVVSALIGGLNSATVSLLIVVTVVAGLTTGWRGNLLTTLGTVLVITVFFVLAYTGNPLPVRLGENQFNVWVSSMVAVVGVGIFLNVAVSHLHAAVQTAQAHERELEVALDHLQEASVSKAYVDSILQSMLDMLIVIDDDMTIVTVNHSTTEQLDYYENALIGKPLSFLLDDAALCERVAALYDETGGGFHTTTVYRTRGGEYLTVDFTASRLRLGGGKQVVCVAHDVTERVRATEALRVSERRLRTAIDNVNAVLFALDRNGVFTFSDGKGLEEIGLTPGEAIGRSVFDVYADLPMLLQDVRRSLGGDSVRSVRDLSGLVFENHLSPILDERGNPDGMIGFSLNITERVNMERKLIEERNLLRTIIDSLPDYINAKDLEGHYILSNKSHMRYCGVARQEDIIGKTADEAIDELVTTSHLEDVQMVMSSGRPIARAERMGTNADGEKVWLQVTKTPLMDANGHMMGVVSIATDITRRKADEERIRASEERRRTVINSAPVFIFAVDENYDILFFEGQGSDELNIDNVGQVLGQAIFQPNIEDSQLKVADAVARAFEGESVKTTVHLPPHTFDIRYSPIVDENGSITRITGVATDITERVRAEEALRKSEARNRALLAALPDAMFVIDHDGKITDYHAADSTGEFAQKRQVVGSTVQDMQFTPHLMDLFWQTMETCLYTGERQTIEAALPPNKNGTGGIFEGRFVKLNATEVLVMVRDVTAARNAQEELQRREAMYRTLARNLPDTAVMLFDHDLRYLITDGPALTEHGFPAAMMEGSTLYDVVSPSAVAFLEPYYRRALAGEQSRFEISTPDDPPRIFAITTLPLKNDHGDIFAGMLVARDVTEDHRKTQELQQFAEELARSNRALQEFAYVASHDLQEPLRKIQAFGDRLMSRAGCEADPTARDYLMRMTDAASRMQSLILDLLTFSRVTTQAQPFAPTDLNNVVRGVITDLELRIEQTGAQVHVGALPTIEAEQLQMRQLFQNLLSNALKYSRPDVPPHVTIMAETEDDDGEPMAVITVSDNGIGFDNQYAERIFGVFQRLHTRRAYEGTGMGLAICRKIVERHGGRITASGQPGHGATFILHLPIAQQQGMSPYAAEIDS